MKKFTVFKVLSAILLLAMVVILTWSLIDAVSQAGTENGGWAWLGMVYMLIVAGIIGGVGLIFAVVGLICTLVKCPKGERKGQVGFFISFTVIPLFVEGLFFLLMLLLS